jgi:hypothetical protein
MEATNRETVVTKIRKTKSAWCFELARLDNQSAIKWLMMKIIADKNYFHFSFLQTNLTKINIFKLKKKIWEGPEDYRSWLEVGRGSSHWLTELWLRRTILITDEQCEILLMACELLAEQCKVEAWQCEIQAKVRELLADAFEVEVKAREHLERQK